MNGKQSSVEKHFSNTFEMKVTQFTHASSLCVRFTTALSGQKLNSPKDLPAPLHEQLFDLYMKYYITKISLCFKTEKTHTNKTEQALLGKNMIGRGTEGVRQGQGKIYDKQMPYDTLH